MARGGASAIVGVFPRQRTRPALPVDLRPRAARSGHQGSRLHSLSQSKWDPKLRAAPVDGLAGMQQDLEDRVGGGHDEQLGSLENRSLGQPQRPR